MEYRPDSTILRSASLSERCHRLSSDLFHTDTGPTLQQPSLAASHDLRAPPTQTREVTKQLMSDIIIHNYNSDICLVLTYTLLQRFLGPGCLIYNSLHRWNEILHLWPPLLLVPHTPNGTIGHRPHIPPNLQSVTILYL